MRTLIKEERGGKEGKEGGERERERAHPVLSIKFDAQFLNEFLCLILLEVHDGIKNLQEIYIYKTK